MSDRATKRDAAETRRSMIRVWLAISAVWTAFWLVIAALVAASSGSLFALPNEIGLFALIVLLPPLALLTLGTLGHLLVEARCPKPRHA